MQPISYTKREPKSHAPPSQSAGGHPSKKPLNCDCMLGLYGVVVCEMSVQSFRRREYSNGISEK